MRRRNKLILDFNKTKYVDETMVDMVTFWMLKVLLKSGGFNEFIDKDNYFNDEEVVYFLELNKYAELSSEEYTRYDVLKVLEEKLDTYKPKHKFKIASTLKNNIDKLDKLLHFTKAEKKILMFVVCLKNYQILDTVLDYLGRDLTTIQVKKHLSIILDLDYIDVDNALSKNSTLITSSLLYIDSIRVSGGFDQKLELLHDKFADFMMNSNDDILSILKEFLLKVEDSCLDIADFNHIKKDVTLLKKHLKKSMSKKQKGVNILLYGVPGTGKTELTKTLAKLLDVELFEVSYMDEDEEITTTNTRIKAYRSAQAILKNKKYLLMYDEAEDIFDSYSGFFSSKKQDNKAHINRMLETNQIPTIWITNNINSVDSAIVRRFDIAMELEIPKRKKRVEILKKYSEDLLDKKTIKKLSHNRFISPAVIQRAVKVARNISESDISKTVCNIVDKTLKAQGHPSLEMKKVKKVKYSLPNIYDPSFINTDEDLELLAQNIAKTKSARICLYGTPGTGKSAYGLYIAKKMGCEAIVKKGSDLLSKWVGGTEQNIAQAFDEAKKKKAVLIFDEVDSFLQDRAGANASWEISQVNELLTQMESFEGVFVATTNLMENLDKASLRRFDLKMEFKYLKAQQAQKLFKNYLESLNLKVNNEILEDIKSLSFLAPGDFNAVIRQNKFRPIKDGSDMIKRLSEEVNLKDTESSSIIGFLR